MQRYWVEPEVVELASEAMALKRAATALRVLLLSDLKKVVKREPPLRAAVAAALASETVLRRAVWRAVPREPEQPLIWVRRASVLPMLVTSAALAPSTSMVSSLEEKGRAPVTCLSLTMGTEPCEWRVMEPPSDRSLVEAMSKTSSMVAPGASEVRASSDKSVVLMRYLTPWNSTSLSTIVSEDWGDLGPE